MEYIFHIVILISIYGILALAQNLVMGMSGLLTIAGAAFYGIGAYIAAILSVKFGVNIFITLFIAPVIAGLVASLVGATFARFRDDYFLLATLGFLMIFNTIIRNWQDLTGGAFGIAGISKPAIGNFTFSTPLSFTILSIALLAIIFAVSNFISRSSFGRVLQAIREEQEGPKNFWYKKFHLKLLIFTFC